MGVIQSNPDQSKHLETARMRVRGVWIDLVNLRSETYAEGSRIPEMTFGTPEQDALRRDLTINALFYNLHTRSVEDLTARGIPDLRAGLCRTPLPPRDTFLDDPLRALRAVRFASRLGFTVDPALASAAGSPEVLQALASKVSRERIGTEVSGMLEGPHPARAVRLLSSMGLLPVALRAPDGVPPSEAWAAAGASCAEGLLAVLAALAGPNDGAREGGEEGSWVRRLPGEQRRVAVLAATLLPLRTIEASAGKKKKIFAASAVVRESLKLRGKDADDVGALHAALPRVAQCARALVRRHCHPLATCSHPALSLLSCCSVFCFAPALATCCIPGRSSACLLWPHGVNMHFQPSCWPMLHYFLNHYIGSLILGGRADLSFDAGAERG